MTAGWWPSQLVQLLLETESQPESKFHFDSKLLNSQSPKEFQQVEFVKVTNSKLKTYWEN
jgi:hypothetical protein